MWIAGKVLAACLALGICEDNSLSDYELPQETTSPWTFNPPQPDPVIKPIAPIVVNAPAPPVVTAPPQIIINPPPPLPPAPPPTPPKPDPTLVAHQELLALRRLAALDRLLTPVSTSTVPEAAPSISAQPSLPSLSTSKELLSFNSPKLQQPEYLAPKLDSGLPVDNTRIITEDEPITVILENGVNSQIPSKLVMVVAKDIYGSHGSKILIPKFSRIICNYDSPDHANSTRIGMSCNRILSADKRFEIYGLNAAISDPLGRGGITGGVDRRFWDRYGTAFLLTGISTAVKVSAGLIESDDNPNLVNSLNQGAEELSQKFGEITAKVLEETVNLKPIITIAQGTRMQIILGHDWYVTECCKK